MVIEKRLNHAEHLLTNAGKTINTIVFKSGFESASHFSRAFRLRFAPLPHQ
jgi:AraC family transcriptional regulator, exoenzyme S synthesis regulatory protein ExsA